jgi:2-polyprenyl-6-methoxyphenol hydroxylase-like FAD-dependent oxidoreductase
MTFEGALRAIVPGTQEELGEGGRDKYIEWPGRKRSAPALMIERIAPAGFVRLRAGESEVNLALAQRGNEKSPVAVPAHHLIERVSSVLTWSPYSTISVRTWSAGRTAVLGDAAHAQPPNLGQGGGMAMQSGLALGAVMDGVARAQSPFWQLPAPDRDRPFDRSL